MASTAIKLPSAAAALALVVALVVPPEVARAEPNVQELGSAAGEPIIDLIPGLAGDKQATSTGSEGDPGAFAIATMTRPIFQNDLWWFGIPNENLARVEGYHVLATFEPLALIPAFAKPIWMDLTRNLNWQNCFMGFSQVVGPYGTTQWSVSRGCT